MKMKILAAMLLLTGCPNTDARVVSRNLSKAADMFEVTRRIVFYNSWNGEYVLNIEGLCSIDGTRFGIEVTCKTGPTEYKKHFLGISESVTYFAEQIESNQASPYHYRVVFKPSTIIPNVEVR